MRYHVVGQNRDTGARVSLELEAESKAAAERKATRAGMSVHHVTDVTDGHTGHTPGTNPAYRGPVKSRGGGFIKLIVLFVILAAVAYFFWPTIRGMMNR